MSILDFVSQDELDDLDDDPRIAFMMFVNLAQRRLAELTARLDLQNMNDWNQCEEWRHSFMNVVVAAGKRFEIEPFVSMEVPRLSDFKDVDHRQFTADLDHYITQLMLDNSMRGKRDSVAILPDSKERIRSYVHRLRQCIEQANMTEPKREALLSKLDQFETELEKRRVNILAVARVVFELLAIPGGVWVSADVAHKLITNVMQIVAELKSAEQETHQLAPVAPPKALLPPRTGNTAVGKAPATKATSHDELDDDIPF